MPPLELFRLSIPSKHVLLVEMNRPPVNAFNAQMFKEFEDLFSSLARGELSLSSYEPADDIRCVILASALSNVFTAGIDHSLLATLAPSSQDPSRAGVVLHSKILALQRTLTILTSSHLRIPVIAAIHGHCIGLGVDIAAACDVRLCAEGTTFCIKEPALSLAPDVGTLARLPHLTSNGSLLAELTFTARDFDAQDAKELGLVSRVVRTGPSESGSRDAARKAVLDEAMSVAERIASLSPVAMVGVKKVLGARMERSVAENLEYVATWNAFAMQTPDIQKAIVAFKSGKAPTFDSLSDKPTKTKL